MNTAIFDEEWDVYRFQEKKEYIHREYAWQRPP